MSVRSVIRLLYAFAATAYSILGCVEFGFVDGFGKNSGVSNGWSKLLSVYVWIRLGFALFQIPAHAMMLYAARYYKPAADDLLNMVQHPIGDRNVAINKYYGYLTKCNFMITVFMVFGITVLLCSWLNDVAANGFYITELVSLGILFFVLAARIYGIYTGTTRNLFYLKWE
jgi:hypothetical protein